MYIALDLETTGVDSKKDKIIEFGAAKYNEKGELIEKLEQLINPEMELPSITKYITNITDNDLRYAPTWDEKIDEIRNFIEDCEIVGHNIKFDIGFLSENGIDLPQKSHDTCDLASIFIPEAESYSLEVLSSQLSITHERKHRALDDAIASMEVLFYVLQQKEKLGKEDQEKIKTILEKSTWSSKDLFESFDMKEINKKKYKFKTYKEKEIKESKNENLIKIITKEENSLIESKVNIYEFLLECKNNLTSNSTISISQKDFFNMPVKIREELEIICDSSKYLSEKKFKRFINTSTLNKEETIVALKIELFKRNTKPLLLSDLNFYNEEFKIINSLRQTEGSTPVVETKTTPLICTQKALLNTPESFKNKHLTLINTEEFLKTLHFKTSSNLHLDNAMEIINQLKTIYPENQTLQSLEQKITMLFGLIGIFFEKYNDKNQYAARAFIKQFSKQLLEFKSIQNSVLNIIETSKELGEIKNETTSETLTKWKDYLKSMHKALITLDEDKNLTYIEINYFGQLQICIFKKSYETDVKKVLKEFEHYHLLNEDIDDKNNGGYILKRLKIEEPIKQIRTNIKQDNLKIEVQKDSKTSSNDIITNFIEKNNGSTVVIFSSKKALESHTLSLKGNIEANKKIFISLYGNSLGKVDLKMKELKDSKENIKKETVLFITKHYWNNFKHKDKFDNLILLRIPFLPPTDPLTIMQSMHFKNGFSEYSLPNVITATKEIILGINKDKEKNVLIADMRLSTKKYGLEIAENLKDIGTVI